jgi:hypothetical protein
LERRYWPNRSSSQPTLAVPSVVLVAARLVARPPSEPLVVWEAPTVKLGSEPAPATVTLPAAALMRSSDCWIDRFSLRPWPTRLFRRVSR